MGVLVGDEFVINRATPCSFFVFFYFTSKIDLLMKFAARKERLGLEPAC